MRDDAEGADGATAAGTADGTDGAETAEGIGADGIDGVGEPETATDAAVGCAVRSRLAVASDSSTGIHPTFSVIGRPRLAGAASAPASPSSSTLRGDRRA